MKNIENNADHKFNIGDKVIIKAHAKSVSGLNYKGHVSCEEDTRGEIFGIEKGYALVFPSFWPHFLVYKTEDLIKIKLTDGKE